MSGNISDEEYGTETKRLRNAIDQARAEEEEQRAPNLQAIKDFLNSDFLSTYDILGKEDQRRFWRSLIEEIYIDGTTVTGIKPRL